MLRLFAWLSLVVLVAMPQRTLVKVLRGQRVTCARVTEQPAGSGAPMSRTAALPIEVDDDCDGADGDATAVNVGAVLAARLAPGEPLQAVAMPRGSRADVLCSRAIQERGPPRA